MRIAARIAPLLLSVGAGCAGGARMANPHSPVAPFHASVADSIRTQRVAPGVLLHRLVQVHAPWRAFVLDVDLTQCVTVRSVKGAKVAAGRRTTSALLASVPTEEKPLAAVNADFFLFAPAGVPVGAHIENGTLISGPAESVVFGMTSARAPWIGRLDAGAMVRTGRGEVVLRSFNRPTKDVPGLVNASWGVALDSTITRTVYRLAPAPSPSLGYVVDTLGATDSRIARGDTLLIVELSARPGAGLQVGEHVGVVASIGTPALMSAVGGRPALMRDSVILGTVDSVGNAGFRGVNPRTAVGIANGGTRLLIAVIDGRQAGYSAGMSLRETAMLLRDMGAREAINLDGGGSSAMVLRNTREPGRIELVNKPSDAVGERPVANALAVTGSCGARIEDRR